MIDWNVFAMGLSTGVGLMCFARGCPLLGLVNVASLALNTFVVIS